MKTLYKTKLFFLTGALALLGVSKSHAQLALDLAGTGDYVNTNYSVNPSVGYTVEFDMYMHTVTGFNAGVTFTCGNKGFPVDLYFSGVNPTIFSGNCGLSFVGTAATTTVAAGTWYHLAYVYNPFTSLLSFYINGSVVSTVSFSESTSASNFIIGDRSDGVTNSNAKYDNLKIWSVVRTPAEIAYDQTACFSGSETGLDVLYLFEEGSGTTVFDQALGNGAQDGLITGSVSWTSGVAAPTSTSTINLTECFSYTSPSGNHTYTTNGTYLDTISNHLGCDSVITINLTIGNVLDQTVNSATSTICNGESTLINIGSSESGITYTLRNDFDDSSIGASLNGNGSALSFSTGSLTSTTTFNVLASNAIGAVDLPTNSDKVKLSSPFTAFGNEITVEAWVKYDGVTNPWAGQSGDNMDLMSTNVWLWHAGSFLVNDNGNWRSLSFPAAIPTGWTHVATIANNAGMGIYFNGVLVASDSSASTAISSTILNNSTSVIYLGQDPRFVFDTGRNSNHAFDNFAVWNVARSASEIASDMTNCLTGTETNLEQYIQFNEKIGTTLNALIGSSGTIQNPTVNWISGSGVCDIICELELSSTATVAVNPTSTYSETTTACDSYFWNGNLYTISGVFNDTLSNSVGCDSVLTLNLTINPLPNVTVTNTAPTLTANATGATYQWVDCGSSFAAISGQTNQNFTASSNGSYAVIVTQSGCTDTSVCELVTNVGLNELNAAVFNVYPNPASQQLTISGVNEFAGITMVDVNGKTVYAATVNKNAITIDISSISNGVYMLNVFGDDKSILSQQRIVVQK